MNAKRVKDLLQLTDDVQPAYRSPLLRPLNLLGIWTGACLLFALQEYVVLRSTPSAVPLWKSMEIWTIYGLITGGGFLVARRIFSERIHTASWQYCVTRILPLSIVLAIVEEMAFAAIWPRIMRPRVYHSYWDLLGRVLRGDCITVLAFFWIAMFVVRGIGYYERFRSQQLAASQLQTELVNARLNALQMQLNPHFLFNTMNGISSLIHVDQTAADRVLEQLSRLLRMTLDRRDQQQVALREEVEFIQAYLEIQQMRFGQRVKYKIEVAPETWDALIPTMILQPIVENAYKHGLSARTEGGEIRIRTTTEGSALIVSVLNTGPGLAPTTTSNGRRSGIGISNVKARLQLHYRNQQSFSLREPGPGLTEATITLPYQISDGVGENAGKLLT